MSSSFEITYLKPLGAPLQHGPLLPPRTSSSDSVNSGTPPCIQAPHRVFFFLLVFTTISMINALCSHSIFQSTDFSIFLTIYQPSLSFTSSSDYNGHNFNNTLSIHLKFFIHLSLVLSLKQNINLGKKMFSVFMLIPKYLSTVHSRIDRLHR